VARRKSSNLTDAELRLMEVVWEKGKATVGEVVGGLPTNVPLAYSTVLTTLRILENKGCVRHTKDGRSFVYHPFGKSTIRRARTHSPACCGGSLRTRRSF
jgi:predicted transcriptional regulator